MLSVIVPTYNSSAKMGPTLECLDRLLASGEVEAIVVDDHSTDETLAALRAWAEGKRAVVEQLPENSDSASAPRNRGIELATGDYTFFLDSDDVVQVEDLLAAYSSARAAGLDAVRAPIMVRDARGQTRVADELKDWKPEAKLQDKLRAIVAGQSLTCSFLARAEFLKESGVRFDVGRRIGEDISFTSRLLVKAASIGYVPTPLLTYVQAAGGDSVTQAYTSAQFADFFAAWNEVEETLAPAGVSFVKEHGFSAVQYALRQYIWFRTERMDEANFVAVEEFVRKHWSVLAGFGFTPRHKELLEAAYRGDLAGFNDSARLRLVVAGHDLKFTDELMVLFTERYHVRVDQWTSQRDHDAAASRELVAWGDVFWAEWMLGAAQWYSENIAANQRLIVRAHRSEMTADFGLSLNLAKVSAVVAISSHCLDDFADRFDIPREKFWLIPNLIEMDAYSQRPARDSATVLAMVGALPKLKGLARAIELLGELRQANPDFELRIYGKRPEELEWVWKREAEREYYAECERRIQELGLEDAVSWRGWADTRHELSDVDFVLSMSDLEGSHLTPGEAFASGAQGLFRPWRGARACYPSRFVFDTQAEMAAYILENQDPAVYRDNAEFGRSTTAARYGVETVFPRIREMMANVRA